MEICQPDERKGFLFILSCCMYVYTPGVWVGVKVHFVSLPLSRYTYRHFMASLCLLEIALIACYVAFHTTDYDEIIYPVFINKNLYCKSMNSLQCDFILTSSFTGLDFLLHGKAPIKDGAPDNCHGHRHSHSSLCQAGTLTTDLPALSWL